MSAFELPQKHIDLMVKTIFDGPADAYDSRNWHGWSLVRRFFEDTDTFTVDPQSIGKLLIIENHKSLNARYPQDAIDLDSIDYAYRPRTQSLTIAEALQALHCYEYQTCEHSEWRHSRIYKLCRALEQQLIRALPAYQDAKCWPIEED